MEQVQNKIPVNITTKSGKLDGHYDDPYWGVIVSMGLMGVISEITYDLKANYNVLGSQVLWPNDTSKKPKYPISWKDPITSQPKEGTCIPVRPYPQDGDGTGNLDVFADNDDEHSLYSLIMSPDNRHKTEYFRIFYWPQVKPNLCTVWKGHREQPKDKPPPYNEDGYKEWTALWPNGLCFILFKWSA